MIKIVTNKKATTVISAYIIKLSMLLIRLIDVGVTGVVEKVVNDVDGRALLDEVSVGCVVGAEEVVLDVVDDV